MGIFCILGICGLGIICDFDITIGIACDFGINCK